MSEPARPEPVIWREPVRPEWIDYNGHLSEAYYVLVLGHATDAVMAAIGLGPAEREATGASLYTVEAHVRYLDEVPAGVELEVRSTVVGATDKALHLWHELWAEGRLRASEEILGLHVDTGTGRATAFPETVVRLVRERLVDPPPDAGRAIALGRRG